MHSLQTQSLPVRHRLTVGNFHRMSESGIFNPLADRIELIEGELFEMAPIGPLHGSKTKKLNHRLSAQAGEMAIVSVQDAVVLDDLSEVYPDIALLRWQADFYAQIHPRPADVLLMIEVADSTVASDRQLKIPLYARHGIVESWLLDVQNQHLEIYRQPDVDGYRQILLPKNDESVSPIQLPELVLEVGALW